VGLMASFREWCKGRWPHLPNARCRRCRFCCHYPALCVIQGFTFVSDTKGTTTYSGYQCGSLGGGTGCSGGTTCTQTDPLTNTYACAPMCMPWLLVAALAALLLLEVV